MAAGAILLGALLWLSLILCQLCLSGYERNGQVCFHDSTKQWMIFNVTSAAESMMGNLAKPHVLRDLVRQAIESVKQKSMPISCYVRLEGEEGYLESPNFPKPYPAEHDCCYDILRPSEDYCGVKLYAEEFQVFETPGENFCKEDWLSMESCVPEGGSRFCGNLTGSTYQYLFQPGSMALRFHFHSGKASKSANRNLGFRLRYRTLSNCGGLFQEPSISQIPGTEDTPCYTRISDKRGSINTPYYPKNYPENIDCVYEFVRPNPFICGIRMRTVQFQLESSLQTPFGGACSDFFQAPGCGFLCGKFDFVWTARYQPGAVSLKFHFHSDERESYPGFLITFEQVYHC